MDDLFLATNILLMLKRFFEAGEPAEEVFGKVPEKPELTENKTVEQQ